MKKVLSIFLPILFSLVFVVSGFADSPMPAPEARRVCNTSITYCAFLDPIKDTVIYSVKGKFELKEKYRIKGWHRSFYISPNGDYVVIGYPGLNLLSRNGNQNPVMVSIYYKGKLTHAVKLRELFHDLNSLVPTVSHYHWVYIEQLTDYSVILKTVEERVFVHLKTGEVEFTRDN